MSVQDSESRRFELRGHWVFLRLILAQRLPRHMLFLFFLKFGSFFQKVCAHSEQYRKVMLCTFEIQSFFWQHHVAIVIGLSIPILRKKEKSGNNNIAPAAEKENRKTWKFRTKNPSLRTALSFCFLSGLLVSLFFFYQEKNTKTRGESCQVPDNNGSFSTGWYFLVFAVSQYMTT